jgi:hypothetical protein
MRRRYPDPGQRLFPWVWQGDEAEPEEEANPPDPPPLREHVRHRNEARIATLWGVSVRVSRTATRPKRFLKKSY